MSEPFSFAKRIYAVKIYSLSPKRPNCSATVIMRNSFINDRIDVALAIGAAGVQLGKDSIPVDVARALLGPNSIIGVSTHSPEEAQKAEQSGADFLLFGPVFFTPSKARYGAPQGLAALQKTLAKTSLPVYAIGGIKAENVPDVRQRLFEELL